MLLLAGEPGGVAVEQASAVLKPFAAPVGFAHFGQRVRELQFAQFGIDVGDVTAPIRENRFSSYAPTRG